MLTPRQALAELRDLFASTHWTQGEYMMFDGDKETYCAVGGARFVAGFDPDGDAPADFDDLHDNRFATYVPLVTALARVVRSQVEDLASSVVGGPLPVHVPKWTKDLDRVEAVGVLDTEQLASLEALVVTFNDSERTSLKDILTMIDKAMETLAA